MSTLFTILKIYSELRTINIFFEVFRKEKKNVFGLGFQEFKFFYKFARLKIVSFSLKYAPDTIGLEAVEQA